MIALMLFAALTAGAAAAPTAKPGQTASTEADAYTLQEIDYARVALTVPGWTLLSATRNLIVFSKGKSGSPLATLWIRGEHYPLGPGNPLGTGESFVTLYDVDCAGQRTRTTSSTVYSGAKMQGSIIAASDKLGEWTPLTPGGFTGLGAETVCHKPAAIPANDAAKAGAKTELRSGVMTTPANTPAAASH